MWRYEVDIRQFAGSPGDKVPAVAYTHFAISSARRAAFLASDSTFLLALYRRSYSCCLPLSLRRRLAWCSLSLRSSFFRNSSCSSGVKLTSLKWTKDRVFPTGAPRLWRTIWLVPALIPLATMIFTGDPSLENVVTLHFLLAQVAVLVCMFVMYFVLLQSLDTIRAQAAEEKRRQQEQMLALQWGQFIQLQRDAQGPPRPAPAPQSDSGVSGRRRRGRSAGPHHRLRQKPAEGYGARLLQKPAADVVIRYYAEAARACGINFLRQSDSPETLPLDEPEFFALLGYLMENAAYTADGCGPGISGDFSQAAHLVGGHDGTLLFVILRFVDVVPHQLVEGAAFENLCD